MGSGQVNYFDTMVLGEEIVAHRNSISCPALSTVVFLVTSFCVQLDRTMQIRDLHLRDLEENFLASSGQY